jgi:hypothetical protein
MISIPPKYSVAQVIGYMKGKSAIHNCPKVYRAEKEFCIPKIFRSLVTSRIERKAEVIKYSRV